MRRGNLQLLCPEPLYGIIWSARIEDSAVMQTLPWGSVVFEKMTSLPACPTNDWPLGPVRTLPICYVRGTSAISALLGLLSGSFAFVDHVWFRPTPMPVDQAECRRDEVRLWCISAS